jgi:hypothetical protein
VAGRCAESEATLRSGRILLLVLAFASAAPAAAQDLEQVVIEIATARRSGAVTSLTASILVEGERIARADLTPPGANAPVALPETATGFGVERTFASESELATALPNGSWLLTLNGSRDYTFRFDLLPVPSPAISAPLPGAILVPGEVTVEFTRCLFCTADADSTEAEIVDSADLAVASESLEPDAESWTPAEALEEEEEFAARIVHAAERSQDGVGEAGDAFALTRRVVHSDEVPFFTGSAPPSGALCLVIGDDGSLDPLAECLAPDVPEALLVDPSGSFALAAGDVAMSYDAEVQPSGVIAGTARADLDGNGSLESEAPLRGKLKGFLGTVDRHVAFDFRSASPAAKLAVRIHEEGTLAKGSLGGEQRIKGTVLGARVREDAPSTLPLGDEPLGWRLDVTLDGKLVEDAAVTLADGRTFELTGRFLFDFLTDVGKLDLRSADGVSVRIEDFRVDDLEVQPPTGASGDFTFKILGQRGRFPLE